MEVKIKKLRPDAVTPRYATDGSGCFDLAVPLDMQPLGMYNGDTITIPLGLAFEIPEDYVMDVFSRSGHGFKNDVRLSNAVGQIDSDYRGEVQVKLRRDGEKPDWSAETTVADFFVIRPGDRIAQARIVPVPRVTFIEVGELSETDRGEAGFGSTGT